MRRITLVMLVGALVLAMAAGAAMAANIRCDTDPCVGTNQKDRIFEQEGNGVDDTIRGRGMGDVINAADFAADTDNVFGGTGNDRVRTDDGDPLDFVSCGAGNRDIAVVDRRDEAARNCEDIRGNLEMSSREFSSASADEIIESSDSLE